MSLRSLKSDILQVHLTSVHICGKPVGPTLLCFGCRNKSKDYIYQEELEAWEEVGMLTLFTAFSRDQAEKRYVTHCLR